MATKSWVFDVLLNKWMASKWLLSNHPNLKTNIFSYGCNAKNLSATTKNSEIHEVDGCHKTGRTNQDVVSFYAYNPPLKYIPKRIGFVFLNLKTLLITKSKLRFIEFRDFRNMKRLRKLYLPENKIEKIPICIFKHVENLEAVDFNGNNIEELNKDTFLNLPNLEIFTANDNKIRNLEEGLFRNNPNLKEIYLKQNKLQIIQVNFLTIKGVQMVDLRYNNCVNKLFECCAGPTLRDFQNHTSSSCKGPEVC